MVNRPLTLLYSFALVKCLSISVEDWLVIREGRSINGYKPSEYMASKKCLAAWSELCFRISKLKSPHIKIVYIRIILSINRTESQKNHLY